MTQAEAEQLRAERAAEREDSDGVDHFIEDADPSKDKP